MNVHVSVSQETTHWDDVEELLLGHGIRAVLDLIRVTETREVEAPRL